MSSKLTSVQDELANKIREFEELRIEKESAEKSVENKNREIEHLEKENSSRQNDIERHEFNLSILWRHNLKYSRDMTSQLLISLKLNSEKTKIRESRHHSTYGRPKNGKRGRNYSERLTHKSTKREKWQNPGCSFRTRKSRARDQSARGHFRR